MSFEFFLKEAWTGFRRAGVMSLVSLVIITVSLTVFGTFLLAIFNLGTMVSSVGSKMEVAAYVDKQIDDYTGNTLMLELSKIEGVEKVKFIHRDEAWAAFKKDYEGRLELGDIVKENPLPNAFVIKVKSPDLVAVVAKKVSNMPQIDEVRFSGNLADRLNKLLEAVRLAGFILVTLLIMATLLIVVNTIRLTVLSRQTDIYIMKLVGATNSFIKWPFILEGVIIGVAGSCVSVIILKFSYDLVSSRIASALPFIPLITSKAALFWIYSGVAALGILLGIIGAYISVNAQLKESV